MKYIFTNYFHPFIMKSVRILLLASVFFISFEKSSTAQCTTPPPTGLTVQNFCANLSPTVAGLAATGIGSINWYTVATGGTALTSSTALVSGTYYASQTVSGCESTTRLAVLVTVNASTPITTPITGIFSLCLNSTVQLFNTTLLGSWTSANTAVAIISNTGVVTAISAGTTLITYTIVDISRH